jgi:hypothetical protein
MLFTSVSVLTDQDVSRFDGRKVRGRRRIPVIYRRSDGGFTLSGCPEVMAR